LLTPPGFAAAALKALKASRTQWQCLTQLSQLSSRSADFFR
jgi:hypothetical protein